MDSGTELADAQFCHKCQRLAHIMTLALTGSAQQLI